MTVRIYVEGGGGGEAPITRCRQAFAELFGKIVPKGQRPKVLPCGSRQSTYDDFQVALQKYADDIVLLLVDSESRVIAGMSPWAHLKKEDGWDRPDGATDKQAHLMVQCMEAWFLADKDALTKFYGQGLSLQALPRQQQVEQVPKNQILQALQKATKGTKKRAYHKTDHGFALLKLIDPAKVRAASPHANRLCEVLARATSE